MMQITVTDGTGRPTGITHVHTLAPYSYTDIDGDRLALFFADIPGVGPGIHILTDPAGCSIAATDVEAFIQAIRAAANATDPTGAVTP